MEKPLFSIPRPCGKMYKKTVKHNLGYRPFIQVQLEKIGDNDDFPYFSFIPSYISCTDFYFYHEKYSKKEFRFVFNIYKQVEQEILVDTKSI